MAGFFPLSERNLPSFLFELYELFPSPLWRVVLPFLGEVHLAWVEVWDGRRNGIYASMYGVWKAFLFDVHNV